MNKVFSWIEKPDQWVRFACAAEIKKKKSYIGCLG